MTDSDKTNQSKIKVCIVTSAGGHLTEALALKPAYESYDYFFVLNSNTLLPNEMKEITYFIRHSERDWFNVRSS